MNVTSRQLEKILKSDVKFSQFPFSMLVTRIKSLYAKDASQAVLQSGVDEINTFLKKYEAIMGADFAVIEKL